MRINARDVYTLTHTHIHTYTRTRMRETKHTKQNICSVNREECEVRWDGE